MTVSPSHDQQQQVETLVAAYLQAVENGEDPDPNKLIRDNPQFSAELMGFFRVCGEVDSLVHAAYETDESQPVRLGDFRIVREISRGGMKIIYEAVQDPLDRRVAVATIGRGRVFPRSRDRFLREQRVLARLHQTHIVPIFAAGSAGPIQYFAMPYIHGATLQDIVNTARELETAGGGAAMPPLEDLAKRVLERGPARSSLPADSPREQRLPPRLLSRPYFRSVAKIMADVAQSLQYAHDREIFHRDLKPGNIMVDTEGQSWLIDFGLAGHLQGPADLRREARPENLEDGLTSTDSVLGTPGYMAPEQAKGEAIDARVDVWGLGATLYELLTLRRARAADATPPNGGRGRQAKAVPPRGLVSNVPKDLEAICRKALAEAAGERYPTARALGEDLNCWLRDEPTAARPAHAPRRAGLWARRNKGWAFAIAACVLGLAAFAVAAFRFEQARAETSEARLRAEERESLLLKVEGLLRPGQNDGWLATAWDQERRIVQFANDHRARNQAAATLAGLDARLLKHFDAFGVSDAAFDPAGKRLLTSTVTGPRERLERARLWNLENYELQDLNAAGQGPVGFRTDGTPFILLAAQKDLTLMDPAKGIVLRRLDLPPGATISQQRLTATTKTGSVVAAAITAAGKSALAAWSGTSGKLLAQFPCSEKATVLAISPDAALVAVGNENGQIDAWSIGAAAPVASLQARQIKIESLAIDRDRRRTNLSAGSAGRGWLLAAGDAGGTVTIWDLGAKIPRSYCRGSYHDVYAVAFAPDGTTLASSGAGPPGSGTWPREACCSISAPATSPAAWPSRPTAKNW